MGPGRPAAPAVDAGPCATCDGRPATACLRCRRPGCARHFRLMYGLCAACAPRRAAPEGPPGPPEGLDVPWIE